MTTDGHTHQSLAVAVSKTVSGAMLLQHINFHLSYSVDIYNSSDHHYCTPGYWDCCRSYSIGMSKVPGVTVL